MIGACLPPLSLPQRRVALTATAISARPDALRPLLREARVGGTVVRPDVVLAHGQVGHKVVLIDTVGLAPARLARLLVRLEQRAWTRRLPWVGPVAALVDAADRVAPVVLASAPFGVRALLPAELGARAAELGWLAPEPVRTPDPPLGLPTRFLEVLAALDGAESLYEAAASANCSRTTVHRTLAQVRAVLGLPDGRQVHLRPPVLLREIVAALEERRHIAESDVRNGPYGIVGDPFGGGRAQQLRLPWLET